MIHFPFKFGVTILVSIFLFQSPTHASLKKTKQQSVSGYKEDNLIQQLEEAPQLDLRMLQSAFSTGSKLNNQTREYQRTIRLLRPIAKRDTPSDPQFLQPFEGCLYLLGVALSETAQYQEAITTFERCIDILDILQPTNLFSRALSLMNLGTCKMRLGLFSEAEADYIGAIDICKAAVSSQNLSAGHPFYIELLAGYGGLLEKLGKHNDSINQLKQCKQLHDDYIGYPTPTYANVLTNLGNVYQGIGSYDDALELRILAYDTNSSILPQTNQATILSLNNLACAYSDSGQTRKAFEAYLETYTLTKSYFGKDHPLLATVQSNLATHYLETNLPQQALDLFLSSQQIYDEAPEKSLSEISINLFNIGQALIELGRQEEATNHYEEAYYIQTLTKASTPFYRALFQINLASSYKNIDSPDVAILIGKRAINSIQSARSDIARQPLALRSAFLQKISPTLRYLSVLLIESGRLPEAQTVLKMLKEEEYVNFAPGTASIERSNIPLNKSERALERLFEQYIQELGNKLLDANNNRTIHSDETVFSTSRNQFLNKVDDWKKAYPSVRNTTTLKSDWSETLSLRHPNAAIYQAVFGENHVKVIITTKNTQTSFNIELEPTSLNKLIFDTVQLLRDHRSDPLDFCSELYKQLISPAEKFLQSAKIDTLFLSLDKSLQYVTFSALRDHKNNMYLFEKYKLINLNQIGSATQIKSKKNKKVSGFGSSSGHSGFFPIPNVERELDTIVKEGEHDKLGFFPGKVWLNKDFNRSEVERAIESDFSMLHFASHFALKPGNMSQSFLLLGDGQHLSLSDFSDFNLENKELVVLSACETGLGDFAARSGSEGEGMATLLQNRGVNTVIASLWPIADQGAAFFMNAFYQELQNGQDYASAVQYAQKEMLKEPQRGTLSTLRSHTQFPEFSLEPPDQKNAFAHPYFWASFIIYNQL
ncbi:CHAT domain-containing protein [Puniceicoccaceae bacterium K14]|nr:CHAT domain-containing protein [Puniceicoccaceae bacterium K14]